MRKDQGGRGWVIVASCFCIGLITDGVQYSYGLLFIEFLREFKQSKTTTSWIGALYLGWKILGPVGSILTNKFGCRTVVVVGATLSFAGVLCSVFSTSIQYLCVSYGCLGGFGILLLIIPKDVIIIQYFEKKRSFAMGISVCGSGIGTIVFSPLTKWLIDEYGWRGTMLIEAGLVLNCVACGLVMRPFVATLEPPRKWENETTDHGVLHSLMSSGVEHEKASKTALNACRVNESVSQRLELDDVQNDSSKDGTRELRHVLKLSLLMQPKILNYILASLFIGISYHTPFTFMPDMAVRKGWSRAQAAWLLTAIGIVNTVCRMAIGKMADMPFVNRTFMTALSICLLGIFSAVMPWIERYEVLLPVCVVFGIVVASFVVTHNVVAADLFGEENITDVLGFAYLAEGLGSLISGPLSGALFDSTGDYKLTFATAGASFVLAGILTCVLFFMSRS